MRFLVFAGYDYYPTGGWDDFKDSFSAKNDALERVEELRRLSRFDWFQIVDLESPETHEDYGKSGGPI